MNHRHFRVACVAFVLIAAPLTVSAADATTSVGTADLDKLFPSFADGHTAGLWLFDEPQYLNMTLTDAGREMYDLRLLAGGRLEPGRFGNALKCSAQSGPAGRESWRAAEYDGLLPDARPVAPPERLLAALAGKAVSRAHLHGSNTITAVVVPHSSHSEPASWSRGRCMH